MLGSTNISGILPEGGMYIFCLLWEFSSSCAGFLRCASLHITQANGRAAPGVMIFLREPDGSRPGLPAPQHYTLPRDDPAQPGKSLVPLSSPGLILRGLYFRRHIKFMSQGCRIPNPTRKAPPAHGAALPRHLPAQGFHKHRGDMKYRGNFTTSEVCHPEDMVSTFTHHGNPRTWENFTNTSSPSSQDKCPVKYAGRGENSSSTGL